MTEVLTEAALFELLSLECGIDADGSVNYYNSLGQLHRVHGPAVEYSDGTRAWFQNGRLQRLDGPAVERPDGFRCWWQSGKRHRIAGPAIEHVVGGCEWYINGRELTEAAWKQVVAGMEHV